MSRVRFVQPDVVRLPLSDGDWIEVKKELNAGEQREMFQAMRRQLPAGETQVDVTLIGRARAEAYIIAWSFVDASGKSAKVTPAMLDLLDVATFKEIRQALEEHEEAQDAKKNQLSNSVPTLQSVA